MANFRPFSGKKGKQDTINGGKPFGFSWFIPTIIKYKKQFACVLIAVLFIQLLGILTPLMTQVVVDQVLSHHAIAIHCPNTSTDQIIESAKIAGAHDFIMELDEGYDTVIGEKGISLSEGQKQRIAIARAIINNPRILIFDEATSALDYESESIIQNNLKEICKGRTVLIIAHRLSSLSLADEILVIDKGELKERGSHDVLMKMNGLYAYLYNQQSKGEIYDDFIMGIRRQAILDYWWHERESIKEGNCTRNWNPDQIESIMNISNETGMCEKQAGRPN